MGLLSQVKMVTDVKMTMRVYRANTDSWTDVEVTNKAVIWERLIARLKRPFAGLRPPRRR